MTHTQPFNGLIEKVGKQAIVQLPFDPNIVWGSKRQHHITGTVSGIKIRGALKQNETGYFVSLGAAWLRDAPEIVGLTVPVELAPEGPQFHQLESDIADVLKAEPEARAFFEALATFYRKGYLRWIDGARKADARAARIAEMVALLLAGKKQR